MVSPQRHVVDADPLRSNAVERENRVARLNVEIFSRLGEYNNIAYYCTYILIPSSPIFSYRLSTYPRYVRVGLC